MVGGGQRRLVVTLAVIDVLLVAVLVVLALRAVEGRDVVAVPTAGTGVTAGSGTAAGAVRSGTAPATAAVATTFRLPSGNISCTLDATGSTCTIGTADFATTSGAGCSSGRVVRVDDTGVSHPCVAATAAPDASALVLPYGASTSVGGYTCLSAANGVTCTRRTDGVGFRLAREGVSTLP